MKKSNFSSIHQFSTYILFAICLVGFFAFTKVKKDTPTVSVSADKMNILYIGIDNPITVAVEGAYSEDLTVQCEDGEVINLGGGHYNVRVRKPGNKKITVLAKGVTTQEVVYRVKRIPDPIAKIGWISGGRTSITELKRNGKIRADLGNWVIEEKCKIQGFEFTWQSQDKDNDPIGIVNKGDQFNEDVLEVLEKVQSADVIYFDRIKARCPGDPAGRMINSMVFKIR